MPTQYNMSKDDDLYRGILAYEHRPFRWETDANGRSVRVPTGPEVTEEFVVGPVTAPSHIKSFVTRKRNHYKNLRIVRVEKVSGWEEVKDY